MMNYFFVTKELKSTQFRKINPRCILLGFDSIKKLKLIAWEIQVHIFLYSHQIMQCGTNRTISYFNTLINLTELYDTMPHAKELRLLQYGTIGYSNTSKCHQAAYLSLTNGWLPFNVLLCECMCLWYDSLLLALCIQNYWEQSSMWKWLYGSCIHTRTHTHTTPLHTVLFLTGMLKAGLFTGNISFLFMGEKRIK